MRPMTSGELMRAYNARMTAERARKHAPAPPSSRPKPALADVAMPLHSGGRPTWTRWAHETREEFRARVLAEAEKLGALPVKFVPTEGAEECNPKRS